MIEDSDAEYYFEDDSGNTRVTTIRDHVARGVCSGIPMCCVQHYVEVHLPSGGVAPEGWGYVPCPTCVATGFQVTLLDCAQDDGMHCSCGQWEYSKIVEDEHE